MARIHQGYQKFAYGDSVTIPLPTGLSHTVPVPDPIAANFAFRVDAVELGHLSSRGEVDTYFNWLTTVTNVLGTFQNAMPRMVRESLRRMGKAMGVEDVDLFLEAPVIEAGPEDRYIEHLQTGKAIPVMQDDQHELYMTFYSRMYDKAVASGSPDASVAELQRAIEMHNGYIRRAQEAAIQAQGTAPVPGVSATGEIDNQMAAAMMAGLPPPAANQNLG